MDQQLRSRFWLRDLDAEEQAAFLTGLAETVTETMPDGSTRTISINRWPWGTLKACLAGLVGMENVNDDEGKPIPFETDDVESAPLGKPLKAVSMRTLNRIPYETRQEIGDAVWLRCKLSAADRKNWQSPQP